MQDAACRMQRAGYAGTTTQSTTKFERKQNETEKKDGRHRFADFHIPRLLLPVRWFPKKLLVVAKRFLSRRILTVPYVTHSITRSSFRLSSSGQQTQPQPQPPVLTCQMFLHKLQNTGTVCAAAARWSWCND